VEIDGSGPRPAEKAVPGVKGEPPPLLVPPVRLGVGLLKPSRGLVTGVIVPTGDGPCLKGKLAMPGPE
jgi:hypothetical protein